MKLNTKGCAKMKEYKILIEYGDYKTLYVGTLHEFCTYYNCDALTIDELLPVIKRVDNADSVTQVELDKDVKYIADLLGCEREYVKFKTELDKMVREIGGE
jgi:hypothetical protein